MTTKMVPLGTAIFNKEDAQIKAHQWEELNPGWKYTGNYYCS